MKITVVGGGPAGLYFAILMKKLDPAHEIEVFERNQRDETFGFGVVFSDATLDNLEAADPQVYEAMNDIIVGIDESKMLRWLVRNRQKSGIKVRYEDQIEGQEGPGPAPQDRE